MASEEIYEFLKAQNRPFSASDILQNVSKEHGKSAVLKSLDKLVNKQKILEKVYGKQKIYCVIQENDVNSTELNEKMRAVDREINELSQNLKEIENKLQANIANINHLRSKMTTEEAKKEKIRLEEEIQIMKNKLTELSENSKPVSENEKEKVREEYEKYKKEYLKRKRICMDVINTVMEGYPKTKKHLLEDIGIETDEDVGFKLIND